MLKNVCLYMFMIDAYKVFDKMSQWDFYNCGALTLNSDALVMKL